MKLLSFAHKNEAQSFFEAFNYRALPELKGLYQTDDHCLLICGEGAIQALEQVNRAFALLTYKYNQQFDQHINMGVCGALRQDIELSQVYTVRSIYGEKSRSEMHFQSYHTGLGTMDLVSSYERVKTDEHKNTLIPFAHLVDREAWSLARCSNDFKVDFICYKVISDFAGNNTNCFDVQEQAKKYSEMLFKNYISQQATGKISSLKPSEKKNITFDLSNFHFTSSQKNKFDKLLHSACIAFDKPADWILQQLPESDIKKLEPAKKRTSQLIFELECLINPVKKQITHQMQELIANTPKNFHVSYDSSFESTEIQIKLNLHSDQQKLKVAEYLKDFPLSTVQKILSGDHSAV